MMHDPINVIKELSGGENGNEALEYFTQIFALQEQLGTGAGGNGSQAAAKRNDTERTSADFHLPKAVFAPAGLLGR
ncbi:hypothetical protein D3C73_1590680 [compost metagenome]